MKAATLDKRRRLVMPSDCPPHAAVTIQQMDAHTWLVKRCVPEEKFKLVLIPVIDRLPADPKWEKVEAAFARAACKNIPKPDGE